MVAAQMCSFKREQFFLQKFVLSQKVIMLMLWNFFEIMIVKLNIYNTKNEVFHEGFLQ